MPFKTENSDFVADKMEQELAANQEYREVLKNALEAIDRRRKGAADSSGRVEFDVDWSLAENVFVLKCSDDGDGMSRDQLEHYTTTLAVQGAGENQGKRGNQGMGFKIAAVTRNHHGVVVKSLKNGEASMVWLRYGSEDGYHLAPIGPDGTRVAQIPVTDFPDFIQERGSGTSVTFLGNSEGDCTFRPPNNPKSWLLRYLNGRFAELSRDGVTVVVRVPGGDMEEWPQSRTEADQRQAKQGGKQFNFNTVLGTSQLWTQASMKRGEDKHGIVELPGRSETGVPSARVHWWVLPVRSDDVESNVSSRTLAGGSFGVLYGGEIFDWRNSSNANHLFARVGIMYAKSRIGLLLEPNHDDATDDFARKQVHVKRTDAVGKKGEYVDVYKSEFWHDVWSIQFREKLPAAIVDVIRAAEAEQEADDPDRRKRIQARLQDILKILRSPRVKLKPTGRDQASDTPVTGPSEDGTGEISGGDTSGGHDRPPRKRGIGDILAASLLDVDRPAEVVRSMPDLRVIWQTERQADETALFTRESHGLRDRAAALIGDSPRTATEIAANLDFRLFRGVLDAMNSEFNPEGDDVKTSVISQVTKEWFEQKLIETVVGIRMLENSSTWTPESLSTALEPAALTAAFISDTYNTRKAIVSEIRSRIKPM